MTSKVKSNAPRRLIVEGRDDQFTIINLTSRHGWEWDKPAEYIPYIDAADGVDNALEAMAVAIRTYSHVGLVVDADIELVDRWQSIRNRLTALGFSVPRSPAPDGTIIEERGKKIGVWLMPDNQNPGKLEDFLALLIPAGDQCWPWAQQAAMTAKTQHRAGFSTPDTIKAQIHTWLAWQQEPGLPFGTAINAAVFAHDSPLAMAFVGWLTRLFK